MKGRKLFSFFFLIATAVASSEPPNNAELLEKIEKLEVKLQQQDSLAKILEKVENLTNDLQRFQVSTERGQNEIRTELESLRQKHESLEKWIQNEVVTLKQKDQNLENQLQSLDEQLKSHQTDVRSAANKVQLVEDIASRHDGLINCSVTALNTSKDIADRLTNLERDILVEKDKIKEVREEVRQNEAEMKLKIVQLSSLHAKCSNLSIAMKNLRAQGKFFRAGVNQDVIVEPSKNRTALHLAAWNDELEKVQELIRNGSNIEAQDYHKRRPLHLATLFSYIEVMRELIASGADVNSVDYVGKTPLHIAASSSKNCTELLLCNGANIDAKNMFDETPLFYARSSENRVEIGALLLKWGANINASNWRGTPLTLAAGDGFLDYVKLLVEKGADVHAKTFFGETAIDLANINKHQDVVNYLKQHM